MYANRRNFRVLKEIWVEEHNGDVIFKSGSEYMAVSCMRNYRNSSFIVDLVIGQITRSTERISSSIVILALMWAISTLISKVGKYQR